MNFFKSGDFHVVTRITGPHHHYLALQMHTDAGPSIAVVECYLPDGLIGPAEPVRENDVRSEVSSGIDAANLRLMTKYRASRIRFVVADPQLKDVYREMAERLVAHVWQLRGAGAVTLASHDVLDSVQISN
jgi:hypothetical protein